MSCFDNIVGITRKECDCLPAVPEDANVSLSGLYLDELAPISNLDFGGGCEEGSVWDILIKGRDYGTLIFKSDLNTALHQRYDPAIKRYVGGVGLAIGLNNAASTSTYVGARWRLKPVKGGTVKINAIGTIFPPGTTAGTKELLIYNSLNQLVGTRTINISSSGSNTVTTLSSPLILPTFIEFAERTEYFFVYAHNQAQPSRQNKSHCCCGGICPKFEAGSTFATRANDWQNWLLIGGYNTNVLDKFNDAGETADHQNLYGLTFSVEIGCNTDTALCRGVFDFANDPLSMSVALGVQFASAIKVGNDILSSKVLNRTAMVNRTALTEAITQWRTDYDAIVAYLRDNLTLEDNDCFMCKDNGLRVQTIATQQRIDRGQIKRIY
jgi:hypothetical protein